MVTLSQLAGNSDGPAMPSCACTAIADMRHELVKSVHMPQVLRLNAAPPVSNVGIQATSPPAQLRGLMGAHRRMRS